MVLHLLILLLLLAGSAFFSASETAFFSLSRYELSRLTRDRSRAGPMVAELMQHPRQLLLTLMIGNVTINMFIFATSLSLFQRVAGEATLLAAILGLSTPVLVTLAGDILPKSVAILLRRQLVIAAAPVIRTVQVALFPVTYVLLHLLVAPLTRLLAGTRAPDEYVTTEELDELIELSERHRIIDADENAMLGEVIRLNELRVYDVMIPRVDMVAFDIHDNPASLRQLMREHKFTKIPVYDATIDNIIGVVYAKDLFLNPSREPGTLVRPVRYVPEMITLMQLIEHFRRTQTQMSIAVNEYGEIAGLVTIEDVASQIVGDMNPGESSTEATSWIKLDERRYRVSGSISIYDWADQFSFRGIEDSVTTLAGLIQARLGRLPAVGDRVQLGNLSLTVESLAGRRVEWVLLELQNGQGGQASAPPAGEVPK
jgi:putative hemolysin